MDIVHQIARELSVHHINLIYVYLPASFSSSYTLPSSLSDGTVCGCIVMNVYDPTLTEMLNHLVIPKVFLDIVNSFPTERINGDLVLLEGRETFAAMVKEFLAKGYTRFGFIGDVDYAHTNCLRYKGFLDGLRSAQLECPPKWQLLSFEKGTDYDEEIQIFLKNLDSVPEVFFCINDHVTYVVSNCLKDMGLGNKDILLVGHDGSAEHSSHSFLASTVLIDTALLGARLAAQLLFRLEHPSTSREIIYVHSDIIHPFPCPSK